MSLKKLLAAVKKHNSFLITSHLNLEGDALSSELSFFMLLKSLGKEAIVVNEDTVPCEYDFLPGTREIRGPGRVAKGYKYDCFVTLDCSDISRCGSVAALKSAAKQVINIDHHISNTGFADINWVDPRASSCAEMVYRLYKMLRVPIGKDAALLLYVGMMTDTGSFRYPNTTGFTHKAVAELMRHKLDVPGAYRNVYENIPFSEMRVLSRILPSLRLTASGRIAYFKVERSTLRKHQKASFDLSEYVLSFARAIKGVEVAALFKENLNRSDGVRVNLRSQGKVDVNAVAQRFGGGGHRTASGITIHGKIYGVIKKVLASINKDLNRVA